jgi:uncharacterized delta-60 repeat protein
MEEVIMRRFPRPSICTVLTLAASTFAGQAVQAAPGDLDPTFGIEGGGIDVLDIRQSSADSATTLSLAADGSMLVGGTSNALGVYEMTLLALDASGNIATGFGDQGYAFVDIGDAAAAYATAMLRDADGNIYVDGTLIDFQMNLDGITALDPGGTPVWPSPPIRGRCNGIGCVAYALARDASGNLYEVGYSDLDNTNYDFYILKYGPDGNITPDWTGTALYDFGNLGDDHAFAAVLDGNGGLYAAGYSLSDDSGSYDFAILKISTTGGALDGTFGNGGLLRIDIGSSSDDAAYAMKADGFGNLYVAGTSNAAGPYRFTVIKLDPTGHLVTSFGDGGKVISNLDGYADSIAFDGHGRPYLAGTAGNGTSTDFGIIELDADTGAPVTSFGDSGQVTLDIHLGSGDEAYGLGIDGSGRPVIVGQTNSAGSNDFAVARLQANPIDTVYAAGFDN